EVSGCDPDQIQSGKNGIEVDLQRGRFLKEGIAVVPRPQLLRLNAKPVGKFTVEAVFLTREIPTGRRLQLVEQRKERGFLYFPGGQGQSVVIRKAQLAGALVAQSDELFQQRRYLAPHCFAGRPSLFTQPLVALLPQDLVQVVLRQTPSVE